MYSTATHDRESSLTAPIISDRSNSSRRGGFLFEYVNEKKYIYIYIRFQKRCNMKPCTKYT